MADRSVVYRLIADASGVLAGTRQASAATRKLADDVTGVSKEAEKTRKGFDQMGRTAGRVGLIAAAGLGAMVLNAANFESAMSNVAAATHESEINMGRLREAAIKAGAETAFSATEAAGAIENLAKAGVTTEDILSGGLSGALSLAAAGQLEVADAAENIATALTQFQLAGTEATHVADLLAAGAGKAQGEVSDMALALDYAGVPASNLGVSIEETAGSIALLAKNGIVGEKAGTSLRGMLSSLTSPSIKAKDTMQDLGIEMFDAQGHFIGLAGVAEQLQSRMSTLTDEERANALGKIFGNEQLQAANVLYREGGEAVEEWTGQVDDAGFAAETAAIKTDNLRGDLERLGGALDTALISGGSGSQGALRGLVQNLTGVVDAYNKLPPSASNAASGLLAAGAIAGGTIWAGSKLVRTISDTRQALEDMGPAGQKARTGLGLATKAVAGLTIGIIAYQEAKKAFDIGIDDEDIRRQTELISARFGPDLQAQIDATTAAIAEQQKITEKGADADLGIVKLFTSQDAADAHNRMEGLTDSLEQLRHEQELADIASGNYAATLPLLGGVVREITDPTRRAADAHKTMAVTVVDSGRAVRYTADQIKAARDAYIEAKDNARGIGEEFFTMGEKVDKAKVSLGKWLTELEKQTTALENFTANSKAAAKNGLDEGLIKSLQDLGPAGALRMAQLADATDAEIDRANRAWRRGQRAIDDYVKATTKVPKPLRVDVETQQALSRIEQLRGALASLRGVHMDVRLGGTPTYATGGAVRGPGGPTSDSIPAYLSNGEYVIKAAAVARYGVAMFDRLNAMHFAQGGHVGVASAPSLDLSALAGLRPLAATVNITPHNHNDFLRDEARLRTAATGDGGRVR